MHIQAIVRATTTGGLGDHEGIGILEQLALGRHDPTGLTGLLDGWHLTRTQSAPCQRTTRRTRDRIAPRDVSDSRECRRPLAAHGEASP